MKKSFYEMYLEKQMQKNNTILLKDELPKIRSPNKMKIRFRYYLWQMIKIIFLIGVCILAIIGCIAILDENIRNQILKLLFGSSFFIP